MRRIGGIVIALTLVSVAPALAGDVRRAEAGPTHEQADHLEHLKTMMREMSVHGPVIPQPESVTIDPLAAKTITLTALVNNSQGSFTCNPASGPSNNFTVNQGDVVTLNLVVGAGDTSTANPAHIFLMETYAEQGVSFVKGQTRTFMFTATTAGSFLFVCNQPTCSPSFHSNMFGMMVVNAVTTPSIGSVSPNSGPASGGTAVTISGANFSTSGTTTVTFGGSPATNVNVSNASTITATTPAHAVGAVDVVVNTGGQSATASGAFTYLSTQPTVTSITPNTGSTAGGTVVTINGTNFQSGATVTIGGIAAIDVAVGSATTITAKTPVGPATQEATQPRDVVVTNPDGSSATLARGFTYFVPPLSIATVSPSVGGTGGGTVVTITGTGFTTGVNSSVTFGGVAAPNVTILDAVTMQATTPAHSAGTIDIVVTFGASVTKPGAFTYQTIPPRHRSAKH
jgi:hypothetical protein